MMQPGSVPSNNPKHSGVPTSSFDVGGDELRAIIEHSPALIYLKSLDGRYLYVNHRFLEVFQLRPDQIVGRTDSELFPAGEVAQFRDHDQRVIASGQKMQFEERAWHRDGLRTRIVYKYPLRDSAGSIYAICGISTDITDRSRLEDELKASEARYRDVVEDQSEFIVRWMPDGTRTFVNEAYARYFNTPPEDLIGTSFLPLVMEEDRERILKKIESLTPENPSAVDEHRVYKPDGTVSWHRWSDRAIFDREGRIIELQSVGTDVTAKHAVEEALRASEERFRNVVENLSEGLLLTDLEDKVLYANQRMEFLTGCPVAELMGKRAFELLLEPAEWEVMGERLERRKRGQSETYSIQVCRRDGGKTWVHFSTAPYRDRSGKVIGSISALTDISERRRAEDALRQNRRFLEKAQEVGHVGSWISYPGAEKTLIWSKETRRIFGVAEFDGKLDTFFARVHPDDMEMVKRAGDDALEGKRPYNVEHRIVRQDGTIRWVHEQADLEYDENDKPVRFVGVVQDITERKQAEEALRRSEEQYRSVVNQVREVIFQTDASGRWIFLNSAWTQVTGFEIAECIGAYSLDFIFGEDRDRSVIEFLPLLQGKRPFCRFEARCRTKGGGHRWIEVHASAIKNTAGQVQGTSGTLNDISQRKQLEEQLRQVQKLDSVGQLAAGIAHDFNNLLTINEGYVSLLLTRFGHEPKLADGLRQIASATERASALTRQLLLFSRRQLMQPKRQDANELIGNMTRMLGRILGEDITLQLNYTPSLPPIHADTGMLEQVVMNLAVNARDAMPNGGQLTVTTSVVELAEDVARQNLEARPGSFVRITVTDTGTGIPPEVFSRIFEPFFTTKDVGKGTGLGLATVHGIVKQHNGWLEVTSKVGQGTTFVIFLPAAAASLQESGSEKKEEEIRGGTETILVVEDEPPVREMVCTILEMHGYKVLTAGSGVEALDVWRKHGPSVDMLFTDMVMPQGMSGKQLAAVLLRNRPELRVVYTSGYSPEVAAKDLALQEGVNFLQKPFAPQKLARIIRQRLDKKD